MLIKYRFELEGNIRTQNFFPLKVDNYFIDFVVEEEKIIALEVVEPANLDMLPVVKAQAGKIEEINIQGTNLEKLRPHLRLVEGLLSTFGLRAIDIDTYTVSWIPNNAQESKELKLYEFKHSYADPDDHNESIPFDLIARSVIAGFKSDMYEVSLSFFRKGKNDMATRSYIDAFYDFYFVLEALFARGKTRNAHIETNFLASQSLITAVDKAKKNDNLLQTLTKKSPRSFDYKSSSPEEIIKYVVKRRGFLHHQNPKHPEAWKPDAQSDFHLDAAFLMEVVYHLIWDKVEKYIFDKTVINDLEQSYKLSQ